MLSQEVHLLFGRGKALQNNYLYLELVVQRITSTSAKGNIQHFIQMFVDLALGLVNYDVCNWRAQSKNDPLIFRPFLKVFRSS